MLELSYEGNKYPILPGPWKRGCSSSITVSVVEKRTTPPMDTYQCAVKNIHVPRTILYGRPGSVDVLHRACVNIHGRGVGEHPRFEVAIEPHMPNSIPKSSLHVGESELPGIAVPIHPRGGTSISL